jgi:hypothetical protein
MFKKQSGIQREDSDLSTSAGSDDQERIKLVDFQFDEEAAMALGRVVAAPGAEIPSIRQSYRYYRLIILVPLFYLLLLLVASAANFGSILAHGYVAMFESSGSTLRVAMLIGAITGPVKKLATLIFAARAYRNASREAAGIHSFQPRFHHIVVIPTYKEPIPVLVRTLESLPRLDVDVEAARFAVHVVLAMEGKDPAHSETFAQLNARFGSSFASFKAVVHHLSPGERPGKGSNENFALREIRAELMTANLDPWQVMVTVCDSDSVFAPDFFVALESAYRGQLDGRHLIYSAPRNTYRNFGEVWNPLISAQECSMNSSDLFVDLTEPYANYSNYSMLLGYAIELDFWDPEVIPEDFHMVYKAMMCSRGAQSVCRVWSTIANDSVTCFRDRYVQAKRHMWGVTNLAWIIAIFREASFSIDRIWFHLLSTYSAEMSETLTPSFAMPIVLGLGALLQPPTHAGTAKAFEALFMVALARWVLQWLVFFVCEAWVWRCLMCRLVPQGERCSWCKILCHYALMPVTMPVAGFIFGNVACWHAVCSAFCSAEFEYITAPKA